MTPVRWLAIIIAVLSVWAGAATQMTELLGPTIGKTIVTLSSLTVATLGAVLGVISGPMSQTDKIQAVTAMPGVEGVLINRKATPELAQVAVDAGEAKVAPAPGESAAVEKIALQADKDDKAANK